MAGFVKPHDGLADLRLDTGLHLGLGLVLAALAAWTGGRLLDLPPLYTGQTIAVFMAIAVIVFLTLPRHLPWRRFGAANRVTLLRAVIAALLAGLVGQAGGAAGSGWLLASLAGLALALDGLDGWAARQSGMASRFGARFDMELDGFFILVLSALVFELGKAGAWVLLSGMMRYGFVGAAMLWPALSRPLPASRRRQGICALQTGALVFCLTPLAEPPLSALAAALALGLLAWSFVRDLNWLTRNPGREAKYP